MVSALGMAFEVVETLVNSDLLTPLVAPIVSFMVLSVTSPHRAEWQQPLQSGLRPYEKRPETGCEQSDPDGKRRQRLEVGFQPAASWPSASSGKPLSGFSMKS